MYIDATIDPSCEFVFFTHCVRLFGPPTWSPKTRGFVLEAQASFAVVIDGDTLRHALSPELKPLFLNLATQCETVVCCRVSPAQKAQTVKLVRLFSDFPISYH